MPPCSKGSNGKDNNSVWSAHWVPCIISGDLRVAMWDGYSFYPLFTNEEMKAQSNKATSPSSPSELVKKKKKKSLIIDSTDIEHLLQARLCVGHKKDKVLALTKLKIKHTLQDRCAHVHAWGQQPWVEWALFWTTSPLLFDYRGKRHPLLTTLQQKDRVLKPE